jgi:hypothetical protein
MKKKCTLCLEEKKLSEFNAKNVLKGTLQSRCKLCFRRYTKANYQANRERYIQKAEKSNATLKETWRLFVDGYKNAPCVDCNVKYPPYVMDFDHTDPSQKSFEISRAVQSLKSRDLILIEMMKCELVCSNCHRIRTHNRTLERNYG